MKIISWNVNGIRAVERKAELHSLVEQESPDILFLQETKAKPEQMSEWLTQNSDYHQHYHSAEKAGYSGVGVWVKKSLGLEFEVFNHMGDWPDREGRVIGLRTKQAVFMGVYFPNGGKSPEAWQEKLRFYDHFLDFVNQLRAQKLQVIWGGDLNVAHNEIDLARPKENEKNIGFLPEERHWVDRVVEAGWLDTFRSVYPDAASYTWWSMKTRARERNIGWRIDYFFVDSGARKKIGKIGHLNDKQGSDHCPVVLEFDL